MADDELTALRSRLTAQAAALEEANSRAAQRRKEAAALAARGASSVADVDAAFSSLEADEQDLLLGRFIRARFADYEDQGEAGWELLRILVQEPTWTAAVYDRSWAPSTVAEIRQLAAETQGSRLAAVLKAMCAMHRDYFLSAVLVPQPAPPPMPEPEPLPTPPPAEEEEEAADMFDGEELAPVEELEEEGEETEAELQDWLATQRAAERQREPADNTEATEAKALAGDRKAILASASAGWKGGGGAAGGGGVAARWKAAAEGSAARKAEKEDQFRSVVAQEMARVKADRDAQFNQQPEPTPAPAAAMPFDMESAGPSTRASWAPDYSPREGDEEQQEDKPPKRRQERRDVDMIAEVVHPYRPTPESEALLEGTQLSLRVGERVKVMAVIDKDWVRALLAPLLSLAV